MGGFRDLVVWQKSIDLVTDVYRNTSKFPREEIFALTSQIRRCAVSIPSNIAEGEGRKGASEFAHFLRIAQGSLAELQTQLIVSEQLGYHHRRNLRHCHQRPMKLENFFMASSAPQAKERCNVKPFLSDFRFIGSGPLSTSDLRLPTISSERNNLSATSPSDSYSSTAQSTPRGTSHPPGNLPAYTPPHTDCAALPGCQ